MPEFEAVAPFARQQLEEGGEAACVRLELRRQPALPRSREMRSSSSSRLLTERSDSRFQCVMNFDAFQANTKSRPVCSRQPSTASGVGVR
jgi:hypothetical protein